MFLRIHSLVALIALACTSSTVRPDSSLLDCNAVVTGEPALKLEFVAGGLARPLLATAPPGDERLFILEQHVGRVRIVQAGQLLATPFLTVSNLSTGGEQGLLGLAFHPLYAQN